MDSTHKDLYRWERLTKPRVYSRSQNVTSKNDIHDWIKTVEDASSTSAISSYGLPSSQAQGSSSYSGGGMGSSGAGMGTSAYGGTGMETSNLGVNGMGGLGFGHTKARTKERIAAAVSDARIEESAYAEAQDLISQWVHEKIQEDAGLDYDDDDLSPEAIWSSKADVKAQWDNLTKMDSDPEDDLFKPASDQDEIYKILHEDEGKLVDGIMGKLRNKTLFPKKFTADLGMEDNAKPAVDPRIKMELRHKMVKENREKRTQEKKRKQEEMRMKKETQFQARRMIQQEEKVKVARQKHEEQEVQKQMAAIRKQMEEEKRLLEEQRNREKREKDALAEKAREELERQLEEERRQQRKTQLLAEQRQRKIQIKMAEIEARQEAEKLRSLQRHFSAWYGVVVTRRVQLGKARATADWRAMLRAWNAWRAYVRDKHLDRETRQHEQEVRERHRKETQAKQHQRLHLLRKHFLAWQIHTQSQLSAKHLNQSKSRTKSKMAAFLEAAATGKLGQRGEEEEEEEEDGDSKVEELFLADVRQHNVPPSSSRSSQYTTRSQYLQRTKKALHKPTQAWQVTRKHAKLTKKELETFNEANHDAQISKQQGEGEAAGNKQSEKEKVWQKAPYVVDSYTNRHQAQQQILQQQQKQIREQQKLIEELTYLQKQQMLQQQLLHSQTRQLTAHASQSDGGGGHQVSAGGDASKLQQHIDNLQKELVAKNQDLDEIQQQIEKNQGLETNRTDVSQMSSTRSAAAVSSVSSASSNNSKHLSFLKSMEERANERARIKKERDEKRKKEEEEKRSELKEKEERLLREQEEEKRRKIEAFREKKRLEKEREAEKQQFAEKMKEMSQAADAHYKVSVQKYRGWLPWIRLVEMARERRKQAEKHHATRLLRKCLLSWHNTVEEEVRDKKETADNFYHYLLVQRYFHNWRAYGQAMTIQENKADRHYKQQLLGRVLREWMDYATTEKMAMWSKERTAREHDTRRIQLTCLRAWRRFPTVLHKETEREKRLLEMKRKVAEMLPDYSIDNSTDKSNDFL